MSGTSRGEAWVGAHSPQYYPQRLSYRAPRGKHSLRGTGVPFATQGPQPATLAVQLMVRSRRIAHEPSQIKAAREYLENGAVTLLAHVIAPVGGQELVTSRLLHGLVERGHPVTVIAGRVESLPPTGVAVHLARGPGRPASVRFPTFMAEAARLIRHHGAGLLHTTGAIVSFPIHVATMHFCHHAYRYEVAVRRASQDTAQHRLNERLFTTMSLKAESWCYRPSHTARLVPVSRGLGREAQRYFPAMASRMTSISNAVDTKRFRPDERRRAELRAELGIQPDALLALFVGGDWRRKGLEFAIRSLATAPEWHLAVVGAGPTERATTWAHEAGVADRLILAGPRDDTERWYAASDAFVFPSSYEAAPLVGYEALASGVPLVASRVNGIEDLLVDGETGFFTDRDPLCIAAKLRNLADNPQHRAHMAQAARATSQRHTWENAVAAYVELYDGIARSMLTCRA